MLGKANARVQTHPQQLCAFCLLTEGPNLDPPAVQGQQAERLRPSEQPLSTSSPQYPRGCTVSPPAVTLAWHLRTPHAQCTKSLLLLAPPLPALVYGRGWHGGTPGTQPVPGPLVIAARAWSVPRAPCTPWSSAGSQPAAGEGPEITLTCRHAGGVGNLLSCLQMTLRLITCLCKVSHGARLRGSIYRGEV